MLVHLLRHGIALDRTDPRCPPDPQRPLTEKGVRRTRAAAVGLRCVGLQADLIVTSPYVRARQTAELVRGVALGGIRLVVAPSFVPEGDPRAMLNAVTEIGATQPLCVGHAPSLDRFAGLLLGTQHPPFALKKAGFATLERQAGDLGSGPCSLVGLFPPSALRQLGCAKPSS